MLHTYPRGPDSRREVASLCTTSQCKFMQTTTRSVVRSKASKVRLEDIAERLGVSVSTVSRSLAGHPAISSETRSAVQAVAAEMGYRIPSQGRPTRKSATKLIGVVVGALHNRFM